MGLETNMKLLINREIITEPEQKRLDQKSIKTDIEGTVENLPEFGKCYCND